VPLVSTIAERAAAERAAELAAAALLAEEEAEGARRQQAQKTKASKKVKAKQAAASVARASAASASAAARGSPAADNKVLAAAGDDEQHVVGPAPSAAADEALRVAMAAAQYEGLVGAIKEHHALASEGVLAVALAMLERLHMTRKQESPKLRRKHHKGARVILVCTHQANGRTTRGPMESIAASRDQQQLQGLRRT
jgi:hypothetical protein